MAIVATIASPFGAYARQAPNAFGRDVPAAGSDGEGSAEPTVFLFNDRGRERDLDRAKRLAADSRWSDAAAACDEILGIDQDAFLDAAGQPGAGGSIRSRASALVAGFPRPGREAYLLLFRARAEKRLTEATANGDREAVVAVARRWFGTPAGKDAAMITAITALEQGQPLVAAMWLDRVASSSEGSAYEPSLSVMRAIALRQSGDRQGAVAILSGAAARGGIARIGGREVAFSRTGEQAAVALDDMLRSAVDNEAKPRGDWLQARGGPSRNTLVDASKPLLVPRYRVPLVRHPHEARSLERRRRAAADAGTPLVPAGSVLAVGEHLVVQTPLGILAIEFESGKRVWLESSVAPAEPDERGDDGGDAENRVFDDATSGNVASDGRLVFAVETPPEAFARVEPAVGGFGFGRGLGQPPSDWNGRNVLRAYDLAHDGMVRWQLPEVEPGEGGLQTSSIPWFLGPPLVTGNELYGLVEEGGEVRLECRRSDDGELRWQQPLASYDDRETILNPAARGRRLAGLTPAMADGVLVCPIGAGSIVAFDTATRSLLWAHTYARVATEEMGQGRVTPRTLGEPSPVIAGGFVLLAPYDASGLICLNLRDGKAAWQQPKRGRYRIAGVVDARVILMSDAAVESLDLATGNRVWKLPLADIGRPSGRGILTPRTLLLPLDTPEVAEIGLADGRIVGRSPSRGGSVPGNLVAHRGEIISRGVDALEVFHQEAALESRIETAQSQDRSSAWASYWNGQLAIERGDVKRGLELVAQAIASPSAKIPPGSLTDTITRALVRDFAAAALWQTSQSNTRIEPPIARMLVDGFLESNEFARAWVVFRPLLGDHRRDGGALARDARDPWLVLARDRWIRGRLERLLASADPELRNHIDEECRSLAAGALAAADTPAGQAWLYQLWDRLEPHPVASELRQRLLELPGENGSRQQAVHRSLAGLATGSMPTTSAQPDQSAWPLGIVSRETKRASPQGQDHDRDAPVPLPLAGAGLPGTRASQAFLDGSQRRLIINDRFGNVVGEPLPVDGVGKELLMPWVNRTSAVEVAVVGHVIFLRTRKDLVAYDLEAAPGQPRGLWRRPDYAAAGDMTVEARWAGGVGGRVTRDGGVPLGMRISEPEEMPRGDGRGMMALPEFLVVPGPRSIALLDPASGRLLWERRRLPPGLEWTADADFACGLTSDGLRSVVLNADDGRLVHHADVPHRRQRLATHGRKIVTIRSIDELPGRFSARHVRLELVDPATREVSSLGEFSGEARATEAGPGRIAVMEPGAKLTVIDLDSATTPLQVDLPDPPRDCERLIVRPWHDRYLVIAGSQADVDDANSIVSTSHMTSTMTGRLWAVNRDDGRPLWPAPAILERHSLDTAQPPDLPVLVFSRLGVRSSERDQAWLGLLVLDKRTGHAVFDDDRTAIPAHAFLGCAMASDPVKHTVTIAEPSDNGTRLTLTFTGGPIPPQAPYRGTGRLLTGQRVGGTQATGRLLERHRPNERRGVEPDAKLIFGPEEVE